MKFKKGIAVTLKAIVIILPFSIGAVIGVLWTSVSAGIEWGRDDYYTTTLVAKKSGDRR